MLTSNRWLVEDFCVCIFRVPGCPFHTVFRVARHVFTRETGLTAQRLPKRGNADLESMRSKDFMARWNIPTAKYGNFRDYEAAKSYLDSVSHHVVLKADGCT